jgi:hypothetical protein
MGAPPGLSGDLRGARLCFGKAVSVGKHRVIPVASVQASGGYGFGPAGAAADGGRGPGGGGAGSVKAKPVGFISIGPDGAQFESIAPTSRIERGLESLRVPAALAGGVVAGAVAGGAAAVAALGARSLGRRVLGGRRRSGLFGR